MQTSLHKAKVLNITKKLAENVIHAQGTAIQSDLQIKGV